MAAATPLLFNAAIIVLVLAAMPSTWGDALSTSNILESGNKLYTGEYLSIGDYKLILQPDCNFVLYYDKTPKWATGTEALGKNCSVLLTGYSELILYSENQRILWRTETISSYGKYALVLKPDGNAVVYGSSMWATGTTYVA